MPNLTDPGMEGMAKGVRLARYSVGTWDSDEQSYTPQEGIAKSFNITLAELRQAVRDLKQMGYSCHRLRDDVCYGCNDWAVLIERTDGASEAEILKGWRR
jgi:hypothetical protein